MATYLGYFRDHTRNVAWVLNPNTDHISAQYHVMLDDMFTTIVASSDTDQIDTWKGLHKASSCLD
eukprot:15364904-Ditylum_brightwellii.AAC.1